MAIELLSILSPQREWHHYTPWILADQFEVVDDDVDSEKTTRIKKDAEMRRDKLAEKWSANIALIDYPHRLCGQLFTDLRQTMFQARIMTPLGLQQRYFYCSSRPASLGMVLSDDEEDLVWSNVKFSIHAK